MAYVYGAPIQRVEGVTTIRPLNDSEQPDEVVAIDIDRGENDYFEVVLTKADVEEINNVAYNRKG